MNGIRFSRFPEGLSPSHFLFAEFFCEIPTLFQKNFLRRFQKTKKRPLHLFSRRSERKKIRPGDFSPSLISEYIVFKKTAPQNHFCEAEIQSHIFLGIRGAPLV